MVVQLGPPIFTIDKVVIQERSNITGALSTIFDSSNSQNNSSPTLKRNTEYNIETTVKNTGNSNANSSELNIFYSSNNSFSFFSDCNFSSESSSIDIAPNGTYKYTLNQFVGDNQLGICSPINSTGAHLFFLSDSDNDMAFGIPFNYSSITGKSIIPFFLKYDNPLESYMIDIYNFNGQKIHTKEVYSIEEENKVTGMLPNGLYIIKSEKGDRKVNIYNN